MLQGRPYSADVLLLPLGSYDLILGANGYPALMMW